MWHDQHVTALPLPGRVEWGEAGKCIWPGGTRVDPPGAMRMRWHRAVFQWVGSTQTGDSVMRSNSGSRGASEYKPALGGRTNRNALSLGGKGGSTSSLYWAESSGPTLLLGLT